MPLDESISENVPLQGKDKDSNSLTGIYMCFKDNWDFNTILSIRNDFLCYIYIGNYNKFNLMTEEDLAKFHKMDKWLKDNYPNYYRIMRLGDLNVKKNVEKLAKGNVQSEILKRIQDKVRLVNFD